MFLKTLLGIGVSDGALVSDPHIPEHFGSIVLHGVHAFGSHYDVTGEGTSGQVGASE